MTFKADICNARRFLGRKTQLCSSHGTAKMFKILQGKLESFYLITLSTFTNCLEGTAEMHEQLRS